MEMINVQSSNIAAIGYDPDQAMLRIAFINGHMYEYYEVPQHIFDELCAANSHGTYAHQNIYKKYRQQRIA